LVLKKMLQKLILLNMRCVIVKTDSKLVVDQLTFNSTNLNEFGLVIED
jgi:ribonuclease HI